MKIKCPACDAVVELDSSMAGQIVDCGCGKKLRVPTVKSNAGSSRHAAGDGRDDASVSEQDSNSAQSFSPKVGSSSRDNAGPSSATSELEQNPFSVASQANPYAASNNPYGSTSQMPTGPQSRDQGLAIASLVLGICSLTLICCGGFLLGIPAVVLGVIAMKKADRGEASGKGMAIAGVTTGGIALTLILIYIVMIILTGLIN